MESDCQSCQQLAVENERLKREIAKLRSSRPDVVLLRTSLFFFGWILLVVLPASLSGSFEAQGDDWTDYVVYGIKYATPWTQWAIPTGILMLLAVSLRKCIALCVGAYLSLALTYWLLHAAGSFVRDPPSNLAVFTAPFAAVAIVAPILVFRMIRRWTIVHPSCRTDPLPVSVATFLTVTLLIAVLLVGVQWFPADIRAAWGDFGVDMIYVFASPLIACSILAVGLVPILMRNMNTGGWMWSVPLLLLAGSIVASISPMLFAASPRSGVNAADYSKYAIFGTTFALTFAMGFGGALIWMRTFGYQLIDQASSREC